MKVIINSTTLIGGVWYSVSHIPKSVPDGVGRHLCDIGAADEFVEGAAQAADIPDAKKKPSFVSPAVQALPERTPKRSKGRGSKRSQ